MTNLSGGEEVLNPLTKDVYVPVSEAEYLLPNPTPPPISRVWVRIKSSKLISSKSLRQYYFVLNMGRLTMFKDSLKESPYGIRPKGSIYLIDHFAESSSIPGESCVAILLHSSANQSFVSSKRSGGGVSPRSFLRESDLLQQKKAKKKEKKKESDTTTSGNNSDTSKMAQSRFSCFSGSIGGGKSSAVKSSYFKILFSTRAAQQEWLVAIRHHISWATMNPEKEEDKKVHKVDVKKPS